MCSVSSCSVSSLLILLSQLRVLSALTVTPGQLTVGREVVAGGVLWVLWTPLKNGISRLLAGFDSIPVMDVIGDAVPKRRVESFVIEA